MNHFTQIKPFNYIVFAEYLTNAVQSNQFSNYGKAVKLLEQRAKNLLKINDSKAIIATNSGASALHAMLLALRQSGNTDPIATQDFTFPCNMQGPAADSLILDLDEYQQIDLTDSRLQEHKYIIIVTNCFGHLQDLKKILDFANNYGHTILFDNAATPYSFWQGTNSCNLGLGAYVSLHHTKPIGFGEGGLVIIDKQYEPFVRSAINFGVTANNYSVFGSNFKMSELTAAGILQWWDSFNIDELSNSYRQLYNDKTYRYLESIDMLFHNYSDDDNFFPNCLPLVHSIPCAITKYKNEDAKKYYKPFKGLPNSKKLYENILCLPITETVND